MDNYYNKSISSNYRFHITYQFIEIKNITVADKNLYRYIDK